MNYTNDNRKARYPKLTECKRIPAQNGFYATPNRRNDKSYKDFLQFTKIYINYIATTHTVHCPAYIAKLYGVHYGKQGLLFEFLHKLTVNCYRQNDYTARNNGYDFRKKSAFDGKYYTYEVKSNASECGFYDPVEKIFVYDAENADFVIYCPCYEADMEINEMLENSFVIPSEEFFQFNYSRERNAFHENYIRNRFQVTNPRSSKSNFDEWTDFLSHYETAKTHYKKHGYIK